MEVPDGYRTESYTVREACGSDCTTTPRTCHDECSSGKNGFAKCRNVCSGGDTRCRTRYCSASKTREIPRTRKEWHTRQVPVYRQEPRFADAFAYEVWEWRAARTMREAGTDVNEMIWPKGASTDGLAEGEQERERRNEKYVVTLRFTDNNQMIRIEVPPDRFDRFKAGTTHHVIRDTAVLTVDGFAVTPLPLQ